MAEEEKRSEEETTAEATAPEAVAEAGASEAPAGEAAAEAAPAPEAAVAEAGQDEAEAAPSTAKSPSVPPKAGLIVDVTLPEMALVHAEADSHGGAGHDDHGHEGHGHVAPMVILLGVLGALLLLTVMTVAVTMVDLGGQGNFIVAMIIATIKAALVMGYFMHLIWDSKFNVIVFTSSFLFVILFLSMALLDRQEYQPKMDEFEAQQALTAQ